PRRRERGREVGDGVDERAADRDLLRKLRGVHDIDRQRQGAGRQVGSRRGDHQLRDVRRLLGPDGAGAHDGEQAHPRRPKPRPGRPKTTNPTHLIPATALWAGSMRRIRTIRNTHDSETGAAAARLAFREVSPSWMKRYVLGR